jgi:2-polyprenyl-3-methyl-5-hydroxy-6-metoxy-1,4-benzoquinol methylase
MAEVDESGWTTSAKSWIDRIDQDVSRTFILDRVMLVLVGEVRGLEVLDVGCGEGRFCRMLGERGAKVTGLDPTVPMIEAARSMDPRGTYVLAGAEAMPFEAKEFDRVVSYITLVDIADHRAAIREMARVLKAGGRLVVATINPFCGTRNLSRWYKDAQGQKLHVAVEDYATERSMRLKWAGNEIVNYHRPLDSYMRAFLDAGLVLRHFEEPVPTMEAVSACPEIADELVVPNFVAMVWEKT